MGTRGFQWVVVALLMISGTARADDQAQQARTLVQVARSRFDQGDFTKAAELLETAYELSPTPEILFNLAKARERAGSLEQAISTLERYLATAPRASDRKGVEATIAGLKQRLDEKRQLEALKRGLTDKPETKPETKRETKPETKVELASPPLVEPSPTLVKAPEPRPLSPWSFVVAGVGVGAMAVGIGLGLSASDLHGKALMGLADVAGNQQRQALGFATGANICFAGAAALMAGGLVWFLVDWLSR